MKRLQSRGTRRSASTGVVLVGSVLVSLLSVGPALGAYATATESAHTATVPEAYELSGLVASPSHPNWYWTHSDLWEPTDVYAACDHLTGTALTGCQQVQRARIWALRIDPATHALLEARPFSLADPTWALDPFIAQNNDWEDIALGPPRVDGLGNTRVNLVIAATGDAEANRVLDAGGRDITCDTRRLIELREPDLTDPSVTTWDPWKIFDLRNIVGTSGLRSCNVESLVVGPDAAGRGTAYVVTKTLRKLFARSLDESTGRDPGTPPAPVDSDVEYRPSADYVGNVLDAKGMKITAADSNGASVSVLVPKTAKHPCWILTWPLQDSGLGATLTGSSPTQDVVTCGPQTEGLAYTRDPQDLSVSTRDLLAVADANSSSRSKFSYWYLPDS